MKAVFLPNGLCCWHPEGDYFICCWCGKKSTKCPDSDGCGKENCARVPLVPIDDSSKRIALIYTDGTHPSPDWCLHSDGDDMVDCARGVRAPKCRRRPDCICVEYVRTDDDDRDEGVLPLPDASEPWLLPHRAKVRTAHVSCRIGAAASVLIPLLFEI